MEIRITTTSDLAQVQKLWAYCFENHEPFFSWYFREYYQEENTLGAFSAGKLLSSLQLIPYDIYLRGQVLPTSYIVGVASFPEARQGGIVGKLMSEALVEMWSRGQTISLLMPFKAGFYYPYQYEFCYHHFKFDIKLEDLKPVAKSSGVFVQIEGIDNIAKLNEVYQKFVANKHGFVVRDQKKWRLLLEEHEGEKGFSYLLKRDDQKDGQVEGYILYYLKDDKMVIREMAYINIEAQRSLFQFMYNHRSQVKALEWNAPLDDTTSLFLSDPKEGVTLFPFLMARIVNVEKLLTSITYPSSVCADLLIRVIDNWAPWNNKLFHLSVQKRKAQVYEGYGDPHLSVDIGALSQLVFGRLGVKDLLYQQRLKGKDHEGKILESLFPPCNNYINEYY